MSIRLPLQNILDITHTDQGTGSVAGGWAYTFKVPQDTDNIVVKVLPSVTAGGVKVYLQTSDDGGTTFYDVGCTSTASANSVGALPQWLVGSTIPSGQRTNFIQQSSVITAGPGGMGASVLGSQQTSGLPILGIQNRVFVQTVGNATAISTRIQVLVNQQARNSS